MSDNRSRGTGGRRSGWRPVNPFRNDVDPMLQRKLVHLTKSSLEVPHAVDALRACIDLTHVFDIGKGFHLVALRIQLNRIKLNP
jgi:hypothetical protein